MDTSLQSTSLVVDDFNSSLDIHQEAEEEHHIHLPGPSFWPLLLSFAILVTITGLLFIPDNPWLAVIAAPFILIGALGWALEDPMASHTEVPVPTSKYRPLSSAQILDQAHAAVERSVTFSSTPFSTHPVKIELEEDHGTEGVVLAVYGKVELQEQRLELMETLRNLPGVLEVKDFIVAEDEIQQIAAKRIENMQAQGKLNGAQHISVLAENYILHLYGDVPDSKMKYALERELIGIPGVTVVVNHIGLNKDIPGNLGKTRNKVGS